MRRAACTKYCGQGQAFKKVLKKIQKNIPKTKKKLAIATFTLYTDECCDMIAMKREVAAVAKAAGGFPWSECQKESDDKSLYSSESVMVCPEQKRRVMFFEM